MNTEMGLKESQPCLHRWRGWHQPLTLAKPAAPYQAHRGLEPAYAALWSP
jgi:hypothetical protein